MRPSLIDKLCCPFDKGDLELKVFASDTHGQIVEGILTCRHCQRYYPIIYGVPIMSPDEYREPALEAPLLQRWGARLDAIDSARFWWLTDKESTA